MTQRPDYSSASLRIVTPREAVCSRPAMYFGDSPPADWPLIFCAWTVHELLDYATEPAKQVDLGLHHGGALTAEVHRARLAWPAAAKAAAIEEIVQRRMWWTLLCRTSTVTVDQAGRPPGSPQRVGDQLIWEGLRIATRIDLDPELFGVSAERLWRDAVARLRPTFATDRFRLPHGSRVKITADADSAMSAWIES
ncbi:hypothetical protein AB0M47_20085 [Hamadaea sp. NPDC051192]|uniref:hypothetical protein n=1 Tax=Hamadaea sp. NPDC051192 TaxID=3154940 RepID=UPI003426CC71